MSNTEELKNYLIDEADGFLLNPDNNGKTIMLSGAWGAGKTHFWRKVIEPKLSEKLKEDNKACVYVSLYGKDNIESLKNEILFKAYESIKDENKLAKRAISAFGFGSRLLSVSVGGVRANTSAVGDAVEGFFESKKIDEAESFLADGGLICLDDFERKSKYIDLNDLFGFIAQLAIDMNCKIVIILNSDVFEGEEANVFKNVKEKTVNKYFHFEPTLKELFDSVAKDEKYNKLNEYKEEILKAIEETAELNARIYIQVLDNCLEWVEKGYDKNTFRELILSTVFFIKHHYSLGFVCTTTEDRVYDIYDAFLENIEISETIRRIFPQYAQGTILDTKDMIHGLKEDVTKKKKDNNDNEHAEVYYASGLGLVEKNKYMLRDFYQYKYILKVDDNVADELFNEINKFVKTGILQKETKEVESSLPPEAIAKIKA